jgi:hypothetical protein
MVEGSTMVEKVDYMLLMIKIATKFFSQSVSKAYYYKIQIILVGGNPLYIGDQVWCLFDVVLLLDTAYMVI